MKNNQKGFSPVFILILLVLVGVVVAAGFLVLNKDSDENSEGKSSTSQAIDASQEVENQDLTVGLNENVDLSNGFSMQVSGIERSWATKKDRTIPTPPEGTEYVAVNITITNNSTEEFGIGGSSIALIDSTGTEYIEAPSTYQLEENSLLLKDLSPGESITGQVVYTKVPLGANLSFIYEEAYLDALSGENIQIKATVSL